MYTTEEQALIRLDIFHWLEMKRDEHAGISKESLLNDYHFQGKQIPLLDRYKGIHNPQLFDETLSVVSTLNSKYEDNETLEGMILYDYQATGDGYGNTKLRLAYQRRTPIIYLLETSKGFYWPYVNVIVLGDDVTTKKFVLDFRNTDDPDRVFDESLNSIPVSEIQKKYALQQTKRRVHQPAFRSRVISAYSEQCAICRLQHTNLLDAAHILPDSHELGRPVVSNGLALCKIHHAAYDKKIIGITPDYKVQVSSPVLKEIDGPMLKHGIQEMHGVALHLPKAKSDYPNPDFLEIQYSSFLETV
jgi:putative restriction endonuclease